MQILHTVSELRQWSRAIRNQAGVPAQSATKPGCPRSLAFGDLG